jgi:hypothetical protein
VDGRHLSQLLLDHPATDLNKVDMKGNTALMYASYDAGLANVKILLSYQQMHQLDLNTRNKRGMSAITYAARRYSNPFGKVSNLLASSGSLLRWWQDWKATLRAIVDLLSQQPSINPEDAKFAYQMIQMANEKDPSMGASDSCYPIQPGTVDLRILGGSDSPVDEWSYSADFRIGRVGPP